MKVIELNVSYEDRDLAKMVGCRWDEMEKKWFVSLDKHNNTPEKYKPYRIYALVDTNDVDNETMKSLGCKWNATYKKWVVSVSFYDDNKEHFDEHNLKVLSKITNVYNYIPPPVKSEEEQLAELIALMQCE